MRYRNISNGGSPFTPWRHWKKYSRSPWEDQAVHSARIKTSRARTECVCWKTIGLLFTVVVVVAACNGGTRRPAEEDGTPAPPAVPTGFEALPYGFRPHPDFELTLGELRERLAPLRGELRGPALAAPQAFLDQVAAALREPPDLLRLVDKNNPLPADYIPDDLVELNRYEDRLTLNREDLSLRLVAMPDLLAMVEAARQDGIVLDLSSTYRSYRYQEWLFQYWVDEIGLERAERSSARPGTSQHQLGTAIDFGSITGPFAEHPAGRWLAGNAWKFGFSLSYPRGFEEITGYIFEPWHFRYISRAATRLERDFFGGIQQYLLEFWDEEGAFLRERYQPRKRP